MVYSLARVGAALGMTVEDTFLKNHRLWVRLLEKGGKRHEMPCHHNLEKYLHAYIDGCGLAAEPKGPLFRTIQGRSGRLTGNALVQSEAYRMIVRRCRAAGIETKAGNHTFRATGITAYLKASGTLERAAAMANHASTRTTQLYDRRAEDVTLDEVERIGDLRWRVGVHRSVYGSGTSRFIHRNASGFKLPERTTRCMACAVLVAPRRFRIRRR